MGRREKAVRDENAENLSYGEKMRIQRKKKNISLTGMANALGYSTSYLSTIENGITAPSLHLLEQYEHHLQLKPGELTPDPEREESEQDVPATGRRKRTEHTQKAAKIDWGEAPIVATFYGRGNELTDLQQWITKESCQVVALLGLGGMGKTALAASLVKNVNSSFDYIFWRSLQNAPLIENVLKSCLQFISGGEPIDISSDLNEQLLRLIKVLQEHRCLIVLDNFETVLESQTNQERWGGYATLLQRVGEVMHQSCLLLTSREKPGEINLLEAKTMPVRSLQLSGLEASDAQKIIAEQALVGTENEWKQLIDFYLGNPLALKLVSEFIKEIFEGSIADFLKENAFIIKDVHTLLEQQFKRLSETERDIMYWLAIEREAITLADLQENIVEPVIKRTLLEAISALQRRFLVEKVNARFFLLPVIIEFMIEKLIEQAYEEIYLQQFHTLENYALIQASAKEYIRYSQIQLILEPVARRLSRRMGKSGLEKHLKQIITTLRQEPQVPTGYSVGNILNLFIHLEADLRDYDFSHLLIRQAYLQGVSLPGVNFAYAHFEQSIFTDTFGSILSIAISADEKYLAAGTADGVIRLWRTDNSMPVHTYQGHSDWVRTVAFSPDGRLLASGADDETVRLWSVKSGQCLHVLREHSHRVRTVAFSPDGSLLVSSSDDQTIRLWEVENERYLHVLRGHPHRIRTVAFSPDGRLLASGADDETIRLWSVKSGQCLHVLSEHTQWVRTVAFSPDGRLLASGADDQVIHIWDVESGRLLKTLKGHTLMVRTVAFSPDGSFIASGSEDRTIRLWDVESERCLKILTEHSNAVRSIIFSSSGNTLVSGSDDQSIRFWEIKNGQCLKTLQGYSNWIYSVAFSPNGVLLASGSHDYMIHLWQAESGRYFKKLYGHQGLVYSVVFSPDGTLLASASHDHTVRLWEVATGQCLKVFHGHNDQVNAVAFSMDSRMLASGSEDDTVRLWDIESRLCLKVLHGHANRVRSVAFSSDGVMLASGSEDATIRLWDISNGQCLNILQGHKDQVRSIAFSPDGMLLISGSEDNTIRLWDVKNGQCLNVLQGHDNRVRSVACSADGTLLASGSEDMAIHIWDIKSGQHLKTLRGHRGLIYTVTFHPHEMRVASGSYDGTVRVWDIESGNCLRTLRSERPYEGMNIKEVSGLTVHEKNTLKVLGALEKELF
jgi:WD40 repeat protein/transcriptional regulator with XRE-family HTH domain